VREIMEGYIHMPDCREPEQYRLAIEQGRPALLQAYRDRFRDHAISALLFPTTPLPARPIGDDVEVQLNGRWVPTFPTYIRNTEPGSVAGLPGVSIPAGKTAGGFPVGIALDGLPGNDRTLLALAAAMEAVCRAVPEGRNA
jgi:Asp-tRNA(Asn)/Glu-tRNA(Gln) amidotransferase A subunit family amidase